MKSFLTVFILFTFGSSYSQSGFGVFIGGNTGLSGFRDYKDFAEKYNYFLSDDLSDKLGKMSWASGYNFGISFVNPKQDFGGYLELGHQSKFSHTKAAFKDEALGVRHFNMRYRSNYVVTGFGGDGLYFGAIIGISNILFESYKTYPSGLVSYGTESANNGKYRMDGALFGFRLGADIPIVGGVCMFFSLNSTVVFLFSPDFELELPNETITMGSWPKSTELLVGIKITTN